MNDRIAQYVEAAVELIAANRTGTSIVEIKNVLEGSGLATEGEVAVEAGGCRNLIVWAGMSQDFADVLKAVLCDKRVKPSPASILTYLYDGQALTFPVAQKPPKNGYRDPHWVPVCFGLNPAAPR